MPARHTAITGQAGFTEASSSAPDRGTGGVGVMVGAVAGMVGAAADTDMAMADMRDAELTAAERAPVTPEALHAVTLLALRAVL